MKSYCHKVANILMIVVLMLVPVFAGAAGGWTLVGWNDLGMHCMDADYAVFSILPPYNTIHAQLINPDGDLVISSSGITVSYEAIADGNGSFNSTSVGKTNFWDHVMALFGAGLAEDEGLAGYDMPGGTNTPREMVFEPAMKWFTAEGVPITPYDDGGNKNYYPMMRLVARDGSGHVLATTDIVLPVSDEMTCRACHASGSGPAAEPQGGWLWDNDPERDYRLNILLLHDERHFGSLQYSAALQEKGYSSLGLYAKAAGNSGPVLCAACHGSNALPGTGIAGIPMFTAAMHGAHAPVIDPANGLSLDDSNNRTACYTCHPGAETRCLRGAMGNAVTPDGSLVMQCQSCHGTMSAVGANDRAGWFEEPTCQSCHTGTAVNNNGRIRFTSSFDLAGQPRVAVNQTFASNRDTPAAGLSLYRFSTGHGGLHCEACHGSTHAIFPSSHINDNVQNLALQGHVGVLSECESCHGAAPRTVSGGPHGMHPVGRDWLDRHEDAAEDNPSQCRSCHGLDYRGTELSRALGDRILNTEFGRKELWRGFQIGCYTCHNGPNDDDNNPNRAPIVSDLSLAVGDGQPASLRLMASDPDGNTLNLRIVSQPVNGTVGLSGALATYYPVSNFSGSESFTYAAWDGSTQSNLGTVNVSVEGGNACQLSCSTVVPSNVIQNDNVQFRSSTTAVGCASPLNVRWNFGDGSIGSTTENPTHSYPDTGSFSWSFSVTADAESCTDAGLISVAAASQCEITCSAEAPQRVMVGRPAEFHGDSEGEDCAGEAIYTWDFGDGSPEAHGKEPKHTYLHRGAFEWQLVVQHDGASCSTSGTISAQVAYEESIRD